MKTYTELIEGMSPNMIASFEMSDDPEFNLDVFKMGSKFYIDAGNFDDEAKNDKELYDRIRNQYGEDMSFGFTLGEAKGNMLDEIVEIYDNLSLSDNRSGVMTGKKIGSGEVN